MARISSKTLSLVPSSSPDVLSYRMYYETVSSDVAVSYDSPFVELPGEGPWNLETFQELQALDDNFNIMFTAIDDGGNESDLGQIHENVPLDFTAPEAPGAATFGS